MDRQKRYKTSLEEISKISEEFLGDIVKDSIYTERNLKLYNDAKEKQKIDKSLFLRIEETIEVIEEAGEVLSKAEKSKMAGQISKYNLMVLAHNLTYRENLLLCCTNFFIGVIGSNTDYTEEDIEFYVKLREHALRSELANVKESGGNLDVSYEIYNYFPTVEKKYYFFNRTSPSSLDKTVFKRAEKKREQLLGQDESELTVGFYREVLNDDLISFIKHRLNALSSPASSGKKRSETPVEENSRDAKKAKTSIFDSREDARKINASEIFDPITPNEITVYENETEEYELEESEESVFDDASPMLQETISQNSLSRDMSIDSENVVSRRSSSLEGEENPATQSKAQITGSPESEQKPVDSGSEYDSAPDEPQDSTSEPESSTSERKVYTATPRDKKESPYTNPLQKREEKRSDTVGGTKQKLRAVHVPWTQEEIDGLEAGLLKVKRPDWVSVINASGGRLVNRTNVQCKDKAKTELKKLAKLGYTQKRDLGPYGYVKFPERPEP